MVMQHDLDMLEVGPVFDATTHTAQLLTLLFFAMMFAPGLPLLMPLCCLTFVMYFRVDKLLLCRFYQKPPQIGDGSIRIVLNFLPYAGLIRLSFALWMFSCGEIFPKDEDISHSSTATNAAYRLMLQHYRESSAIPTALNFAKDRVLQQNVFPLFVAIIVLVAVKVIRKVWRLLPIHWILKLASIIYDFCSKEKNLFLKTNEKTGSIHGWELTKLDDPLR
jgi:hypothetical protein